MMAAHGKYIITGGGTGGHIFPALAIADALRAAEPECDILFVGAKGKMEMDLVPKRGYDIRGLEIRGFNRQKLMSNFALPYLVLKSVTDAIKLIIEFKPDAVVGVGGYASGPVGAAAVMKGLPLILQEQNSFAGATNRMLARFAKAVCVAYPGMDAVFGLKRTHYTGNPVRVEMQGISKVPKSEALKHFNLPENNPTVFVTGGSLGAGVINEAIASSLDHFRLNNINLLWMTGKSYYERYKALEVDGIAILPFIDKMELAYRAADLVVCRAGALTISELACQKMPSILVPSPNVAEDHQTKNAKALVEKDAAIMVSDDRARTELWLKIAELLNDKEHRENQALHIAEFARPDAGRDIAEIIRREALK